MPDNVLSAKIIADGGEFTKTLGQLQKQLKAFEAGLKTATNPESFARLGRAVEATKAKIAAFSGVQGNFTQKTNQATLALGNLGRVAQDAPFGFLGIANNLNPLLESFQRLKATTGSAGGAFKALGASLTGPAGIGIALSVVSSLLIVFGDRLFGASKASKAAEESINNLAKAASDDLVKLTSLVGVIKNVATSTEDRAKALKAFNQEYKSYLSDLGIEEAKLSNINLAYEKIIDSMLRQAVVKGLQEQISESVNETAKALIKLQIEEEKRRIKADASLSTEQKAAQQRALVMKQYQQYQGIVTDGAQAEALRNQKLDASINKTSTYEERQKALTEALKKQLAPLLNLTTNFEDLNINLDKVGAGSDKAFNKLIANAKRVAAFFNERTNRVFEFEVDPEDTKAETADKAREFIKRALDDASRNTFAFKLNTQLDFKDLQVVNIDKAAFKVAQQLKTEVEKLIKGQSAIEIQAKFNMDTAKARGKEFFDALGLSSLDDNAPVSLLTDIQKEAINTANLVNATLVPAFESMFDSFANGENAIEGFFKGIVQSLKKLAIQLATTLVKAVLLKAVLSAFGGDAAGKSVLDIFKSLVGFRAAGGPVGAGQPYVVGEKGPELFVPSTGGRIIPNNAMGSSAGRFSTQPVVVQGQLIVRGPDLIAVLANANRSQNNLS